MRPALQLLTLAVFISFASCQKGVDWGITPPSSGGGGGTGGTGGGGNSNGDLLVKGVSTTAGTTDTNVVTLTWNANKKLTQYKSVGRTNGIAVDGQYDIIRQADGRIQKIFSKPFSLFPGMGAAIDSIVYYPNYQGTTNKFSYVRSTTYTTALNISDSMVFTYNAANRVEKKETYRENIITGAMSLSARETYTYDGNGNLLTVNNSIADPITGVMAASGSTIMTYSTQKAPATWGEEAFLVLAPENVSVNNITKKIQSGNAGGGSVSQTMTANITIQQTNSFGRPTKGTISTTPVPPGYTLNFTYYYQ